MFDRLKFTEEQKMFRTTFDQTPNVYDLQRSPFIKIDNGLLEQNQIQRNLDLDDKELVGQDVETYYL